MRRAVMVLEGHMTREEFEEQTHMEEYISTLNVNAKDREHFKRKLGLPDFPYISPWPLNNKFQFDHDPGDVQWTDGYDYLGGDYLDYGG